MTPRSRWVELLTHGGSRPTEIRRAGHQRPLTPSPPKRGPRVSSRRTLILIAAIAIGGLAAFALFNYVGGIEDRANDNAERVDVFVVRRDIPKGLPGEQAQAEGFIELDQIPQKFH